MSITDQDRARLTALAREAVVAAVSARPLPLAAERDGIFGEKRGCFVTLTSRGRLRGCIGTFTPPEPLGKMIVQMAAAAAREDPRFFGDPITEGELGELAVEVSVLSPLVETHEPEKLRVGVDGIYIIAGGRSGCFLPEVATDQGWSAEEFLTHCCQGKAHLPPDAWRDPGVKVYLFTSEKFGQ